MPTTVIDLNAEQPNVRLVDLSAKYVNDDMLEAADVPDALLEALDEAQEFAINRGDEAFVIIRIKPTEV